MVCFIKYQKYQVKPTCEEMASLLVANDVSFSREEVAKGAGRNGLGDDGIKNRLHLFSP